MFPEADDYFWTMAARKRLILFDEGRAGLLTFFLLQTENEIPIFYDRRCWSMPKDHETGSIVYIDKLVVLSFNRGVFQEIERAITQAHPSWEQAVWYRYRARRDRDMRYTLRRRVVNAEDLHR